MKSKLLLFVLCLYSGTAFSARRLEDKAKQLERCERLFVHEQFNRLPIDYASYGGLVTNEVPLSTENILNAFSRGLYAIGYSNGEISWINPPQRGVLFLDKINLDLSSPESAINSRDRQFLRNALAKGSGFSVTFDEAFEDVIRNCQMMTRYYRNKDTGQLEPSKRWIQDSFVDEFTKLHKAGYAHSVEVWNNGKLVAGLYGVFLKGVFSGESMFHLTYDDGRSLPESSNAVKLAAFKLIERLKYNGHEFIDTQMLLGIFKKWGGELIPRDDYLLVHRAAQQRNRPYHAMP